ncbi:hypothetical protein AVEN_200547-1 [Araneus ventricosus]|uniref:Uncharacterized protein n=1 Tax=Araneus ventricosus TaxID=182803 RepID=A0A4Y2P9U3_ARAVE|nr:hypothetical protein AVEN_83293-1 [Araneus ventricosus]GBN47840.1 hypothetical protein AVEN_125223-1 [Araneus ventricosus]GBN47852.1 hypothetical protein AVEN_200547-1 [Araneus ventricosus]
MATLHRETNRPLSVIIQRLAGYLLAGRHTMGILALSIHLDSNLIGRHHPLQLQQMDSCVAGNHSFTVQWRFGTATCRSQPVDIGQAFASRGILSNLSHLPSIFYCSPKFQFF